MPNFRHITFKEKQISEKLLRGYKVYSDKTTSQNVEASTAAEAIEKSGIKNPFKIEVIGVVHKSIFSDAELAEITAASPVPPEQPQA